MNSLFILFWNLVIFSSLAWYGFLVFYIGAKGGKEIRQLTRELQDRPLDSDRTKR